MMFLFYKTYLLFFIGRDERVYGKPRNSETGTRNPEPESEPGFWIPDCGFSICPVIEGSGWGGIRRAQSLHLSPRSAPRHVRHPQARGVSSHMIYQKKYLRIDWQLNNKAFAKYRGDPKQHLTEYYE